MFPRLLKRRHASTRSSTTMPNRFRIASTSSSVFCLPHALVMDVNKRSDCLGQRKWSHACSSVATRRCRRRAAPCAAFRACVRAPFRDPLVILRYITRHFNFRARLSLNWHRARLPHPSVPKRRFASVKKQNKIKAKMSFFGVHMSARNTRRPLEQFRAPIYTSCEPCGFEVEDVSVQHTQYFVDQSATRFRCFE